MKSKTQSSESTAGHDSDGEALMPAARPIHPEDIVVGDRLALAKVGYQYPSFFWCSVDSTLLPPCEPVNLTYLPIGPFEYYVVRSVCLPFVLVETFAHSYQTFDVRQTQFFRISDSFFEAVQAAKQIQETNGQRKKRIKRQARQSQNVKQKNHGSTADPAQSDVAAPEPLMQEKHVDASPQFASGVQGVQGADFFIDQPLGWDQFFFSSVSARENRQ